MQVMSSKQSGNYLFFEENEDKGRIYYSLVSMYGDTIRTGDMSLSVNNFVDAMQRIGFEIEAEI